MDVVNHNDLFQMPEHEMIEENPRSKTSLRMHYEAQAEVIRKQIGDLEQVRLNLGLSARKLCQLIMVDPSAWTRWTKHNDQAPPHVWRALQWYMIIQEKIPGLTPQYFVGKDPEVLHQEVMRRVSELTEKTQTQASELEKENRLLKSKVQSLENAVRVNKITAIMIGFSALILGLSFAFALYKIMRS